jgi:hypothetical protein
MVLPIPSCLPRKRRHVFGPLLWGLIIILQFEVDLTGDDVPNLPSLISGKEHYPLIIFQGQEHAVKSILMDILG